MNEEIPSCSWQVQLPHQHKNLGARERPIYYYLIGDPIECFGQQLPTHLEIIKLYCFEWNSNKSDADKFTFVVNSIEEIWRQCGIPVRATSSIRLKVKNMVADFKRILKTRRRRTAIQLEKENIFLQKSGRLFDVVEQNSETILSNAKRLFLYNQRNSRTQNLSDMNLNENHSELEDDNFNENAILSHPNTDSELNSDSETDSQGNDSESNSDEEYYPSSSEEEEESPPKKKLKQSTIEMLDYAGLSYRQMHLAAQAFIHEFDENPSNYCIGSSTFHSNSTKIRNIRIENISEEMKNGISKLVLLFDTKSCTQLNAVHLPKEKRLAIVLHSQQHYFGLEINRIDNSTADTLSAKLKFTATEFNLIDRLIGLVCDTENTNTGYSGGTCVKFESEIQKELLRLCCRHHILELVLKKVCQKLLQSRTPEFSFEGLVEIKNNWMNLNKNDYRQLDEQEFEGWPILSVLREQAIQQITNDTNNSDVRDDYAELNDICLKLLGFRTSKKLRVIGAMNKARWISRALLVGKTYLLRDQLNLDAETMNSLRRICIFVCCLYTKYWNRASDVLNAPFNDLCLMQQLHIYKEFDDEISLIAIDSMREHLWYLGGELIVLSLFSNNVTTATKNKMRHRIRRNVADRDQNSLKFFIGTSTDFGNLDLEHFITERSYFLFQLLQVIPNFLEHDAATWENYSSYRSIKNMIEQSITVVNDGAERFLGISGNIIKTQRARKEHYFKDLAFSRFDKNKLSVAF